MAGNNGTNGKHHGHTRVFKLQENHIAFVPCPSNIDKKICYKTVNVVKGDHCMKTGSMECEDGHPYLVWHSHEHNTYMISSE